jgi:hypothetical protein
LVANREGDDVLWPAAFAGPDGESLLGDGNVFPDQVVSALGSVTLSEGVSKLVAGLGFTGQIKTLYLDVGEPTIQGKRKKIAAMSVRVHQTRGLKMGTDFDC